MNLTLMPASNITSLDYQAINRGLWFIITINILINPSSALLSWNDQKTSSQLKLFVISAARLQKNRIQCSARIKPRRLEYILHNAEGSSWLWDYLKQNSGFISASTGRNKLIGDYTLVDCTLLFLVHCTTFTLYNC